MNDMTDLTDQLRTMPIHVPDEPDMLEIYARARERVARRRRKATAVLGGVAAVLVGLVAFGTLAARPSIPRDAVADGVEPIPTPWATSADAAATVGPDAVPTPVFGDTYVVQPEDTLSSIADKVYGDPLAFGVIASANGISESNPLRVGQEIIIPPNPITGEGPGPQPTMAISDAPTPGGNQTYIVQPGDTLSGISELIYGDPECWWVIGDANSISESNPIRVGLELDIPSAPDSCARPATPTPGR